MEGVRWCKFLLSYYFHKGRGLLYARPRKGLLSNFLGLHLIGFHNRLRLPLALYAIGLQLIKLFASLRIFGRKKVVA